MCAQRLSRYFCSSKSHFRVESELFCTLKNCPAFAEREKQYSFRPPLKTVWDCQRNQMDGFSCPAPPVQIFFLPPFSGIVEYNFIGKGKQTKQTVTSVAEVKTPNLPFLWGVRPKSWTGACVCRFTVFVFLTSVFLCLMFYHLLFTVCSSCYVFPSLCPAFYVSFHEKLTEFTRHGRGSINKKLPLPSPNYHCCWVYFFSVNIAVRVGRPFFPTIGIGPCGDTSFFIF